MVADEGFALKASAPGSQPKAGDPGCDGSLVLFPGALGDAVCLEPSIAYLAGRGPTTIYARGAAAEVCALFPARPLVRSLDGVEVARLFSPQHDPRTDGWLSGYARIVSFTGASVAVVAERLRATGRATLAAFPRPPLAMHAADYFLGAVTGDPAVVAPAPTLVRPAEPVGHGSGRAELVLLPGSGGRAKRVGAAVLATLAARWQRSGGEVLVVLGPAEAAEDATWAALGRVLRPSSIAQLAALLPAAAAFVGNDAGPSHVAAALGLGGVVFYAVTDPAAFGPRGAEVSAVQLAPGIDPSAAVDVAWAVLERHLP